MMEVLFTAIVMKSQNLFEAGLILILLSSIIGGCSLTLPKGQRYFEEWERTALTEKTRAQLTFIANTKLAATILTLALLSGGVGSMVLSRFVIKYREFDGESVGHVTH